MTIRRLSIALLCTAALLLPTAARAAEPEGVEAVDAAWKKAILAGDVEAVVACYADDAVLWTPHNEPAKGKDAIRAIFKGMLAEMTVTDFKTSDAHYKTAGDHSVGWATFAMTLKPANGGDPVVIEGRYSEVAEKRDGKWVFVLDHASADQGK